MDEQNAMTIDEAVSALSSLEREKRKEWQAVQHLKGVLSLSQSMRNATERLRSQAEEFAKREAAAKAAHDARLAELTNAVHTAESDYAKFMEQMAAKQQAAERETLAGLAAAKKQYESNKAIIDAQMKALEEERRLKISDWDREQQLAERAHAEIASSRRQEVAELDAQLGTLKKELAKIEALFARRG